MNIKDIDSFSYSRDGFKPHVKSPIIWGNKGTVSFPLCYLTKPKSLSIEDWNAFLDGFDFSISKKETTNEIPFN